MRGKPQCEILDWRASLKGRTDSSLTRPSDSHAKETLKTTLRLSEELSTMPTTLDSLLSTIPTTSTSLPRTLPCSTDIVGRWTCSSNELNSTSGSTVFEESPRTPYVYKFMLTSSYTASFQSLSTTLKSTGTLSKSCVYEAVPCWSRRTCRDCSLIALTIWVMVGNLDWILIVNDYKRL